MHRKRFLPDLSVRASNVQGLRGPHWPRSLLQPGSTTRAWVRKSSPNTIVLGVRLRAGTRAVAMGRSWGLRVSSLLFALRLTQELPKVSATTPLAQKRRIYVLPFFNLPCMYDTQSTLRTTPRKTHVITDAAVPTVPTVLWNVGTVEISMSLYRWLQTSGACKGS